MIEKERETDIGPVLEVYPYRDDFILHGELLICRVSRNLELLWEFGGRDIFVKQAGDPAFEMKKDRICLYDWENNYYEIAYDGTLMADSAPAK